MCDTAQQKKIRATPGIHICLVERCRVKQSINQLVGHDVKREKKKLPDMKLRPSHLRAGIFSYIRHSIYHVKFQCSMNYPPLFTWPARDYDEKQLFFEVGPANEEQARAGPRGEGGGTEL